MWTRTALTERLKIRLPIVQGPLGGGMSTPKLVAAVAEAGGLGSFGAAPLTPEQITETIAQIRAQTKAPFAINLWVPPAAKHARPITEEQYRTVVAVLRPYLDEMKVEAPSFESLSRPSTFDAQVRAVLEAAPPIFSFVFNIPSPEILKACRERNILTIGTAINVDEAVALERAGVDFIVASCSEAGGLRASFLPEADEQQPMAAFLPQVTARVKTPIIAAGGITDGRGVVAALAYGASGVQLGTAFVACEESNATSSFKAAVLSDRARHTSLTRAFMGITGRAIANRFVRELAGHEAVWPGYPAQFMLTQAMRTAAAKANEPDLQPLWAGQNAALLSHTRAADLVQFLVEDTNRTLSRLAALAPRPSP